MFQEGVGIGAVGMGPEMHHPLVALPMEPGHPVVVEYSVEVHGLIVRVAYADAEGDK